MKNFSKLSGLLIAIALFTSSCSKNKLAGSYQQERLAKLSAELEQNYSSPAIAASVIEKETAYNAPENRMNETARSTGKKELSGKINPVKAFKAIKETKKIFRDQKISPEKVKSDYSNHKSGLSQKMKLGIILALIGLIVMAVLWQLYWIGGLLFIVGAVLILIELLEM